MRQYWESSAAIARNRARPNADVPLAIGDTRLALKTGPLRSKREPVPRASASGSRFDLSNVRGDCARVLRRGNRAITRSEHRLARWRLRSQKVAASPSWPLTKKFARASDAGFAAFPFPLALLHAKITHAPLSRKFLSTCARVSRV